MYVFRTSGETLPLVVEHRKHAYATQPKEWDVGETVLLSKNKKDLGRHEKQIQYIARIVDVRPILPGEAELYWGAKYEGKWNYLIQLSDIRPLTRQFGLAEVIGTGASDYWGARGFSRLKPAHEAEVERFVERTGQVDL
jgi:hypothetical protein